MRLHVRAARILLLLSSGCRQSCSSTSASPWSWSEWGGSRARPGDAAAVASRPAARNGGAAAVAGAPVARPGAANAALLWHVETLPWAKKPAPATFDAESGASLAAGLLRRALNTSRAERR